MYGILETAGSEFDMGTNYKKSVSRGAVLVIFGLLAMVGGEKWLVVLIPAALLVWYGGGPALGSSRN